MEVTKYYELEIGELYPSGPASLVIGRFEFDSLVQVKYFLKKIRQSIAGAYKLYETVGEWNMETGAITYTRTQMTSL